MLINALRITFGALSFGLVAARPLVEDGASDLSRKATPDRILARQEVARDIETVHVTVDTTVIDYVSITITIGGEAPTTFVSVTPVVSTLSSSSVVDVASAVVASAVPTSSTSLTTQAIPSTTMQTTSTQAPAAPVPSSAATTGSSGSNGACTTGDPKADIGFYLTNAGSKDATYYIYAALNNIFTSETIPYKCAEVGTGQTVFVALTQSFGGRIQRGLPYAATSDHPARGPASFFEFVQVPGSNNGGNGSLWGDVSLIQGYDGAISFKGTDGSYGFNNTLDMAVASATFPSALATKTTYPTNIPAPTVIGPTVATTVASNIQAFNFLDNQLGSLQDMVYLSNIVIHNPSFQTSNNIWEVTFYEGLV